MRIVFKNMLYVSGKEYHAEMLFLLCFPEVKLLAGRLI